MKNLSKILGIILSIFLFSSCKEKPLPPVLSTDSVSLITTTSAVSGGNVTDDGGASIISRGVCWNLSDNPVITNNKTFESGGSGSFTSNLTQLTPNTIYFVRAYATNTVGTSYGPSVSFKTIGDKPTTTASNASEILTTSAKLNGAVNPNYLATTVTFEYGITTNYGSTSPASQSPLNDGSDENVSVALTALNPGKLYHFRVKAENSLGITYSNDVTFTTLGQVPTTITQTATNLQLRTAILNGSVNPNYFSSTVTFEWGMTTSYGNSITPVQSPVNGSTVIDVNTILPGLTPGTTYHFRIKAANELGSSNGSDLTFTTLGQIPSAISQTVTNLQITQTRVNGLVNPHYLPTMVFFEWGTTISFGSTLALTQNPIEGNTSINLFADLSGLSPETTYYFRIKASNELGTSYSENFTFTTYALVDIENNFYHSLTVGSQTWMKENLKVTKYINGDLIGTTSPASLDISGESTPKYQWAYQGDESKVALYGRLYTWYAVSDSRNVCPTGWHIPTDDEWTILTNFLGGESIAGGKLKEVGTTHWSSTNPSITNESGFTALPGGWRVFYDSSFFGFQSFAAWWSSTSDIANTLSSWNRELYDSDTSVHRTSWSKKTGFSVRCIKN